MPSLRLLSPLFPSLSFPSVIMTLCAAFAEGEEIEIVSKTHADDGWWVGRTKDGREGAFPANHVKEVEEAAP